jgi:peptide/nickel transport system ATP-binding protein
VSSPSSVLQIRNLSVAFPGRRRSLRGPRPIVHAVDDVTLDIHAQETLALVGESGSGKSTVAAALTGLVAPDDGRVSLDGTDVLAVRGRAERALRRRISLVLQDPFSSLDPRRAVGTAIGEPLAVHRMVSGRRQRDARVAELLDLVGLPDSFASRYPHELSGGQRQRVSIARALAPDPDLIILDESTASLDVSVQARVLDLLAGLQDDMGLTYLFIGHDLAVIQRMSHDVLVMRAGRVVEYRPATELFASPEHEYTRALLAAVPPERPATSNRL